MGRLIEFYRPLPKPQQPVPVVNETERIAPADILRELVGVAETIDVVLVLTMDKQGRPALISNLDGPGENMLFIEQIKAEWLAMLRTNEPPPKGTA
jgi:hypothetical protein